MPKTSPWHSKKESVYHNNTKCGPGNEISGRNWVRGKGASLRLCRDCAKLNKAGK